MSNFSNLSSKLSPRELIQSVFSTPFIGATCTPAAEELCQKNNLNFVNLIQPFCKLTSEGIKSELINCLSSNLIPF